MNQVLTREEREAREEAFISLVCDGKPVQDAAEEAGYSRAYGSTLAKRPKIQQEIYRRIATFFTSEAAPRAAKFLFDVVTDDKAPAKVRLDAAKDILNRAGFMPHSKDEKASDRKELNEMTPDELRAKIGQIEGELADRATPVNAPNAQDLPVVDVQLLDILS